MVVRIDPFTFVETLVQAGIDLFAGVPDSLLSSLCACLCDAASPGTCLITANEGNAVGVAAGHYLATGRPGCVFMQNSGLGNAVNPVLSLIDADVYAIPVLFIVGWRGEPDMPDEPQHVTQGRLTLPMLDMMGIESVVLTPQSWEEQVREAVATLATGKSYALVIRKDTFSAYALQESVAGSDLTRERALEVILSKVGTDAVVVSTTGKTSREIFEIRERRGEGHERDFLTVGSMGHASSIAWGMALNTSAPVWCIDGDGAFLMHMGAAAINAQTMPPNLHYIVINNGAHESVGGQPTVGFDIDIPGVLHCLGFTEVSTANTETEVAQGVAAVAAVDTGALVVTVRQGSRADLGRPTTTPRQNKDALMKLLASKR